MAPRLLFLLAGILITHHATADSDNVLCFAEVNEINGKCQDLLGDGVSVQDCCQNIKYAFKEDPASPCVACRIPEWSQWGEWSPCTVSCKLGVQQRQRVCIGQGDCDGNKLEVRTCSLRDCCPQSGGWSPWSAWSSCSVTCESGQRKRTRQCNSPSPVCGGSCPGSPGRGEEVEACDTMQVCPTHGQWSNWGNWGQCSSTCIVEGSGTFPTQSRFRQCNNPTPSTVPPGNQCPGNNQELQDCTSLPFCPVDGQWGAWQAASGCSVTCGIGRVAHKRSCDSPAPKHGGKYCSGSPNSNTICNTKLPCPVDGTWSSWGEWSECKRLGESNNRCTKERVGTQLRKRKCFGAAHDGKWCDGDYKESRYCYNANNCFYSATWAEWSQWGLCSSPCGQSERKRFRECLPTYPNYPNNVAGETMSVDVFFWGTPIFKCTEINGETNKLEETEECENTPPCT